MGIFPANKLGDDIEVYQDENRQQSHLLLTIYVQQTEKPIGPNYCLSWLLSPSKSSGKSDFI